MALVKLNNRGVRSATTFGSISALGEMRFISKQTASSSSTISFTSGIDSTYKEYLFTFKDIHPGTDSKVLQFQCSIDGGSNYNTTMTTTFFIAGHNEGDTATDLSYKTGGDQAQGTSFQRISASIGADNDQSVSGYLHLFNPASTTFVKHFIVTTQGATASDESENSYCAGYVNTTSAVDAVQFSMASGNIDAGDICLYGIN